MLKLLGKLLFTLTTKREPFLSAFDCKFQRLPLLTVSWRFLELRIFGTQLRFQRSRISNHVVLRLIHIPRFGQRSQPLLECIFNQHTKAVIGLSMFAQVVEEFEVIVPELLAASDCICESHPF